MQKVHDQLPEETSDLQLDSFLRSGGTLEVSETYWHASGQPQTPEDR